MGVVFLIDRDRRLLFFKELKISAFDPVAAAVQGVNVTAFHYLLMSLVSLTTVGAFDAVGAILAVAMLVLPGATAYLLTDRLETMLALSVGMGAVSSVLGYLLARATDTPVAGAMAVAGGALFARPSDVRAETSRPRPLTGRPDLGQSYHGRETAPHHVGRAAADGAV